MSWSIWTFQRSCAVRPIDRGFGPAAPRRPICPSASLPRAERFRSASIVGAIIRNLATLLVANEKQKLQNRYELWYLHCNA
jgi:hypothetical protein